jgi:hypothetical protein
MVGCCPELASATPRVARCKHIRGKEDQWFYVFWGGMGAEGRGSDIAPPYYYVLQ